MDALSYDILSNRLDLTEFLWFAIGSLCLLGLAGVIVMAKRGEMAKTGWYWGLFLEYIWLVLCFTVICRQKGALTQFFPIPFYNYGGNSFFANFLEYVLNILMFVPIGYFAAVLSKRIKCWHVLACGLAFSICIEILQWFLKCGSCETNDVINNTLGAVIGFYLSKFTIKYEAKE